VPKGGLKPSNRIPIGTNRRDPVLQLPISIQLIEDQTRGIAGWGPPILVPLEIATAMKALTWQAATSILFETVPIPNAGRPRMWAPIIRSGLRDLRIRSHIVDGMIPR